MLSRSTKFLQGVRSWLANETQIAPKGGVVRVTRPNFLNEGPRPISGTGEYSVF